MGYDRIQQEDIHLQIRKRALTRNRMGQHLDLNLPTSRIMTHESLVFKPKTIK
jgi:hypothetical protein